MSYQPRQPDYASVRTTSWIIINQTSLFLLCFQPACFYTWYAARRDMPSSPSWDDWRLLRRAKRCSMVGIVLTVCTWVPVLLIAAVVMIASYG